MANTITPNPTGDGWDEAEPLVGSPRGNACLEIRDLRMGMRIRLAKEHDTAAAGNVGLEHKKGSAKIYAENYSAAWPTTRPDTKALSADDSGRMAIDTTSSPKRVAVYVHPSWIEIGEIIGDQLITRGASTAYGTPVSISLNDDVADDPANEFRLAITGLNTLKLQGRNATDDGWVDLFTWIRGTPAITAGSAIAMGTNKITGLAAGDTAGDAVRYEQVCRLVDAQTVAGVKTFSDIPILPDGIVDDVTIEKVANVLKVKGGAVGLLAEISKDTNGYIKLGALLGGLIIQWGRKVATANGTFTITFAGESCIDFPTAGLGGIGIPFSAAITNDYIHSCVLKSISTTQLVFRLYTAESVITHIQWIAWGY